LIAVPTARKHNHWKHRLVRELGSGGMMNGCEGSINLVMKKKPKMLIGFSQKGTWAGSFVMRSDDAI
jgi:hypothetical protein